MALTDTLSTVGIGVFGSSMPVLAPAWAAGTPALGQDGMSLALSGGSWISPLAGFVNTAAQVAERAGVMLRGSRGEAVPSAASVLTLFPQQYLRLAKLYAVVLEGSTATPVRPVPAHVVLGTGGLSEGAVDPGDPLVDGSLSFHDQWGQPIDPLAVASVLLALMNAHQPLQLRALGAPFDPNPGLSTMLTALASTAAVRVRFTDLGGSPVSAANLTGLTSVAAPAAIHSVAAGGTIGKAAVSASFTAEDRRTLVVGFATTGRLGDSVTMPQTAAGVTLVRDFFSLRVLDLRPTLLGAPASAWEATSIEPQPAIRRDEPLRFLADGNDVLGAATEALTGAPLAESIAVAPTIDGAFTTAATTGTGAHWPQFPPRGSVADAPAGAVPIALRAALAPSAAAVAGTPDVVLTLNALPAGASVRAYNRLFSADAVESRGDGAGGIADASGVVRVLLRDPLGLRRPGQPPPNAIPADSILHIDVVVVKRSGESRMFGDVSTPITGTPPSLPAGTNPFGNAARRGICNAGILGLGSATVPPASTSALDTVLSLLSEGTPRDAPRYPSMARRELLVTGLAAAGGPWQAVLAAGRLAPELHNASPRLGAPGGKGGRETQAVGVSTSGGRLAYDIARAGLRRTTNIVTRITSLLTSTWDEPPATTAGTFAGAVLQTVASGCETPELSLLRTLNIVDPNDPNFPRTFDALIARVQAWLTTLVQNAGLPSAVTTKANELINKLDELSDNAPADESTKERIFNELLREVTSSGWGRRDAQWALQGALGRAQRFVYIETPGLGATAATPLGSFAADLWDVLASRLSSTPSLHLIVCCAQLPDFPFGYNEWTDFETASRRSLLLGLPTASSSDPVGSRVVAFHPIGFPGRPSRLESTVVIVDDAWAMVGSSTFRRRGLAFDGGADLVCTDLSLNDGRSAAIADFRRALQATRLGIAPPPAPPTLPSSSWVRLGDGVGAFHQIRETLRAGGLGRIARLTPGEPLGRPPSPGPIDVVSPDSETLNMLELLTHLLPVIGARP
jgi:hypothetical protein